MLAALLVALSLGLSNFAASVGIGIAGIDARTRLRVAVGFALSTYDVSLIAAVVIIGAVSVALSLAGLELGNQLGAKAGRYGGVLGGVVLTGVGVAIATGAL